MLDALAKASPQVLEPIVEMIITAPDGYMGDITGDLASRRGQIVGTDNLPGGMMEIRAQVPLAELENYATRLHALTQGAGALLDGSVGLPAPFRLRSKPNLPPSSVLRLKKTNQLSQTPASVAKRVQFSSRAAFTL